MKYLKFLFLGFALASCSPKITPNLPGKIDPDLQYLFYLHGGVVQAQGLPAVSTYYGKYEYLDILKTFRSKGFYVISEVRPKDTEEATYAEKVSHQIDSLLAANVHPGNITIVGASQGAYIAVELANIRKQEDLKYALLGLCSEYAVELYQKYKERLCGNFLSIYEASDSKSSCRSILENPECKMGFEEIRLETGIDHAFLFKPYDDWVEPLVKWIREN